MLCRPPRSASPGSETIYIVAKTFVDTNIFVYALDEADMTKHRAAREVIQGLVGRSEAVVSTQVLQEFFNVATRKLGHAPLEVKPIVQRIALNELVIVEVAHVMAAIDSCVLNALSFWDALVVAAAASAHCSILLTEDLQDGKKFGELTVRNPFSS